MKTRFFFAAGILVPLMVAPLSAAVLTWDSNPASPGIQDGAGTWGTVSATWNNGTGNVVWSNSPVNDAVFGAAGTGGTITLDGTVSVGNITFQSVTGNYTLSSGTLTLAGAGGISTFTTSHLGVINSVVAGSSRLVKEGNAVLVLGGTNTYSGGTDINAGTLRITSTTGLGAITSALSMTGSGILELNSAAGGTVEVGSLSGSGGTVITRSIAGGVTLRAGGNNQNSVFGGTIQDGSGSVTFSKRGTGILTLASANTYSGQTFIADGGILRIGHGNALGSAVQGTVVNSGTLQLSGGITVTGEALTLNTPGPGAAGAFNNLSGNNTWTGAITLGTTSRISSTSGTLAISGNVTGSNTGLTLAGSGAVNITGAVSLGTGALVKLDDGAATLNALSYTGSTTLGTFGGSSAGTLSLTGSGALSTGSMTVYSGTLSLSQAHAVPSLSLGGGATGTTATLNLGNGGLTLNGDLAYNAGNGSTILSGQAAISGGTLNMGSGTRIFNVGDSSAAAVDLTVSSTLTGGALRKTGIGTLRLTGVNTHTGSTTISGGTLIVESDSGLGQAPLTFDQASILLEAGARLSTSASFTLNPNRGITINAGGTGAAQAGVAVGAGTTLTYGGAITGSGVFAKSGSGTLQFSGTANHTGYTAGTEPLDPPLGTTIRGGVLDLNGGTINHTSSYLVVANLSGDQGGLVIRNGGVASSLRGIVGDQVNTVGDAVVTGAASRWSSAQGLYVGNYGSGILTLANGGTASAASGTGLLYLGLNNAASGGTLNIGAGSSAIATGAGVLVAAAVQGGGGAGGGGTAVVQFNHTATTANPYHFTRTGAAGGSPVAITGTSSLIHTAGATVLSGANSFTGTTVVNGGSLELAAANALQATPSVTMNGGRLALGTGSGNLINNNADIVMGGGTFATNGHGEVMGSLTVFENSVLDLGTGASVIVFADSSGPLWTGNLTVTNWSGLLTGGGTDQFRFQSPPAPSQLGRIFFQDPAGYGAGTYGATILGSGEVVPIPEPAPAVLGGLAALVIFWRRDGKRPREDSGA